MSRQLLKREDVPQEDTWDLASIFASDAEWEAAMAQVEQALPGLSEYQGRLGDSPAGLADWMEKVEGVLNLAGKVRVYGGLPRTVNMTDQEATAKQNRVSGIMTDVLTAIAFGEPELLALGRETLQEWQEAEPRLALYGHYFDSLFVRQPHIRSAEVEGLLQGVGDAFNTASRTHGILADADLTFASIRPDDPEAEQIPIAQSNIRAHLAHPDRERRRQAWQNHADGYLGMKNTMANCLLAAVKQHVFMARARNYESSLAAALLPNYIPVEVFHTTVETFRRHLPVWHRYWRVRRQALGYDKLHVYDIWAPLTQEKPAVSFEQTVEWISEGMAPLGDEYVVPMRRGVLEQRWVDKYPNQGKRSGAFSAGTKGTHPFIFMAYNDDLFGLSTLAHELGHSLHSYFTWQNQPQVYSNYTLFVAEVASNFNQALVRHHLLQTQTDPTFQIAVLEEAMANFHRYFFIMPTLARFELEIHERVERGEPLTAQSLNELMLSLYEEGYGGEMEIDADRIGITWAQFSGHMYANFYVYQYTTGIAAAHALAAQVLAGDPTAAENYLAFLKAGDSMYPLEALKMAGVDMTTPAALESAFAVLADYVERLESLTVNS